MLHTVGQYGYAVSMVFACLGLLTAICVGGYGMLALLFASDVRVDAGRYFAIISTSEVEVNWQLPGIFAGVACLWALIGLGFHAL